MEDKLTVKTKKILGIGLLILVLIISTTLAFGHGGKHAEFTHLQALQKATQLYDRLIVNGKLDQSWETTLVRVDVSNRRKGNKNEVVLSFQRAKGEPQAVYIFFTADGKYAGSNFTGE